MVIVNEECDYVVKNIKPISTLLDSYAVAQSRVPPWIKSEIARALRKRIEELPSYEENQWEIEEYDAEISITSTIFFNNNNDIGTFYGIERLTWDAFITYTREDGPFLYLYYRRPEKSPKNMKQKITAWEEKLINITRKNKAELLVKYHVLPPIEDEKYLVVYFLNDILNANTIGEDLKGTIKNTIDLLIELMESTKDFMLTPP